jgi:WD40 repeat protein
MWQVGFDCGSRIEIYDVETKELLTEERDCVSVLFKNDKKGFIIYTAFVNLGWGARPQLNFYNGAGDKIKEYDKGGAGGFALDTGEFYLWHAKYLGNNKGKKMISRFDENGNEVWEKEVNHGAYDVTVSRNGDYFAIWDHSTGGIILYNRNGEMLKRIQDANSPAFSPNGKFFAYQKLDKKNICLISCNTLSVLWKKTNRERIIIHSMAINKDGKCLYMIQRERRNNPEENPPLLLHKFDAFGNILWSIDLNNFLETKSKWYKILTYPDNRMVIISQRTGWEKFLTVEIH